MPPAFQIIYQLCEQIVGQNWCKIKCTLRVNLQLYLSVETEHVCNDNLFYYFIHSLTNVHVK